MKNTFILLLNLRIRAGDLAQWQKCLPGNTRLWVGVTVPTPPAAKTGKKKNPFTYNTESLSEKSFSFYKCTLAATIGVKCRKSYHYKKNLRENNCAQLLSWFSVARSSFLLFSVPKKLWPAPSSSHDPGWQGQDISWMARDAEHFFIFIGYLCLFLYVRCIYSLWMPILGLSL